MLKHNKSWVIIGLIFMSNSALASYGFQAIPIIQDSSGQTYSLSLQLLLVMTALSLLPAILLAMTSFTRILIVLGIMRQALGMPQTPNNQILIGLSLFLSFFVMRPIVDNLQHQALRPYIQEKISASVALDEAGKVIKAFMLEQTRENDLNLFHNLSHIHQKTNTDKPGELSDDFSQMPFSTIMPAFITSELKTAFQIGFVIYIPFLIIDFLVASVLMAMGMMMLSPMMISLPFKIMIFVLVDGWSLLMSALAKSFGVGNA